MDRREFLKSLGGATVGLGLGKEARGQQEKKNTKEKLQEIEKLHGQALELDAKEETGYKKYITTKHDSSEERELHGQLSSNRRVLRRAMDQLLDIATASLDNVDLRDSAALKEANQISERANNYYKKLYDKIKKRDQELSEAGKPSLDLPLPPQNPRPRE